MAETLTKEDWETAMATVLASKDTKDDKKKVKPDSDDGKKMPPEFFSKKFAKKPAKDLLTEIPAGGGFQPKTGKPDFTSNKVSNEIPNAHPAGTAAPITPADPQKNDTDDDKNIEDEIPFGGGFQLKVGKPEPKNVNLNEIPNNHPPAAGSPRTPAQWAAAVLDFGSDTSRGWSSPKQPLVPSGTTVWGQPVATGNGGSFDNLPADGKTVGTSTDGVTSGKAVRTSMASDLGSEDHSLSMPDGSFFIAQPGDLHAAVAKVQNAEKAKTLPPGHPAYVDVKRHIARRGAEMGLSNQVPADWQLSMAMKAESEIARKFDADTRKKMASEGTAMPNGGYPIANLDDLHNAIQAIGRANPGERASVKAHIAKRARALGAGSDVLKHIGGLGK